MGRFGQKTGAGYYRYQGGDRTPQPDPEVERIILDVSREMGIERRPIPDEEILARLLYPMVNEGAKILEERMAIRPSDIDVIWVYGYGWPVYRGGPMYWADQVGLGAIRDRMLALKPRLGDHWQPADRLLRLADSGRGFIG
jgi:3-hydroxyacyl-CoA dehydrogenase